MSGGEVQEKGALRWRVDMGQEREGAKADARLHATHEFAWQSLGQTRKPEILQHREKRQPQACIQKHPPTSSYGSEKSWLRLAS
jgi:hypothetical protein